MLLPKSPHGHGWYGGVPWSHPSIPESKCFIWYHRDGLKVLTAVESVEKNPPGSGLVIPHFHVSATRHTTPRAYRTCTDQEIEMVRRDFDMGGAEEDNHGAGKARHLWLACDREGDREPECPCKQDEDVLVEGDRVQHGIDGKPPEPTR